MRARQMRAVAKRYHTRNSELRRARRKAQRKTLKIAGRDSSYLPGGDWERGM